MRPIISNAQHVRKYDRMTHGPVLALFGLAYQYTFLYDAIVKFIKADFHMVLADRPFTHRTTLLFKDIFEIASMQPFQMNRIQRVLHNLQPVTRNDRVPDRTDHVFSDEEIVLRECRY